MKKIDKVKETYSLWWKYLTESEGYKKLCNGIFETSKLTYDPATEKFDTKYNFVHHYFWTLLDRQFKPGHWSFEDKEVGEFIKEITFDKWWEYRKSRADSKKDRYVGIRDYSEMAEDHIDHCIDNLKEIYGREPSLQEFKDYFVGYIRQDEFSIYLWVSPQGHTTEDLQKKLGEIVGKRRKDLNLKNYDMSKRAFEEPNYILSSGEIKALSRYLEIYKLRSQGLIWKEVFIQHLSPSKLKEYQEGSKEVKDDMFEEVRTDLHRDYRRAKKILYNVTQGIFPGDYK